MEWILGNFRSYEYWLAGIEIQFHSISSVWLQMTKELNSVRIQFHSISINSWISIPFSTLFCFMDEILPIFPLLYKWSTYIPIVMHLQEMLLLLLPILNSSSMKSLFRPFSKDKSSGSEGDDTLCPICKANPTIAYVSLPCHHRYINDTHSIFQNSNFDACQI